MFCGLADSSATACTKCVRARWYCSNTAGGSAGAAGERPSARPAPAPPPRPRPTLQDLPLAHGGDRAPAQGRAVYSSPRQPGGRKRRGGRGLTAACDVIAPPAAPRPAPAPSRRGARSCGRSAESRGAGPGSAAALAAAGAAAPGGGKEGKSGAAAAPRASRGVLSVLFLSSFFFFFSSFPPPVAATPGPRGAAPAELRAADGAAPSGPRRHRPELPRAAAGTPRASCCSGGARSGPTPRGRPVRWVMEKSCAARLRAGREKSLEKSGGAQESRRSFNPQNPAALGGARTGSGPEPQKRPRAARRL